MGVSVSNSELSKLRAKAQAHDDYLIAIKHLAGSRARLRSRLNGGGDRFVDGYEAALVDLTSFTEFALRDRLAEAGG